MVSSTSKKILIVDDEQPFVEILKERLEFHGYGVLTAKDGKEGVDVALAEKPDLILMDIVMPEIDGVEAVRILQSKSETQNIPIICLSALGQSDIQGKAIQFGAKDYMVKPFEAQELLDKIVRHMK